MKYPKLFEPGYIGKCRIKNRVVMPPMHVSLTESDGTPGERMIRYYEERAKGGVGLIITEAASVVDDTSSTGPRSYYHSGLYQVSPMERLTEAVHKYGAKIFAQLYHGGATCKPAFIKADQPVAPSDVPAGPGGIVPRALSTEEVKELVQKFIDGAVLCKEAGYDGVVLHTAHGYIMAEFISEYYNKRTDEYGGSFENRMRFHREIIEGIRKACGPDYPISVRMCGDEMTDIDGFMDLEYGIKVAKYLQDECGIDVLDLSCGSAVNPNANCEPYSYKAGWKKHVGLAYKEVMDIPVIQTNTLKDPDTAEQFLEEGVSDFVAVGRGHFADPQWVKKAYEGRPEDIRKCIGCMYCRERVIWKGLSVDCTVNPRIGCEYIYDETAPKTGDGRKVAVIGAGPAGLQAAGTLAERGFDVTVYEKDEKAGGRMNLADKPRFKENITDLTRTMEKECLDRGVKFKYGVSADAEMIKKELDPVGVFICTGADWIMPPVPGIDTAHVCTPEDVLLEKVKAGKTAVVVGSGNTGLECVEKLQDDGAKVAMVDMLDEAGKGIYPIILNDLMSRITPNEPQVMLSHRLVEITDDGVVVEDVTTGEKKNVPGELVCLSVGSRPDNDLIEDFYKTFEKVEVIGSAVKDGRIHDATKQAYIKGYVFD